MTTDLARAVAAYLKAWNARAGEYRLHECPCTDAPLHELRKGMHRAMADTSEGREALSLEAQVTEPRSPGGPASCRDATGSERQDSGVSGTARDERLEAPSVCFMCGGSGASRYFRAGHYCHSDFHRDHDAAQRCESVGRGE